MTKLQIIAVLLSLIGLFQTALSAEEFDATRSQGLNSSKVAEGWISLFDGKSTFGWRKAAAIDWVVEEEALTAKGSHGLLRTAVQFDDFDLRLEYKAEPSAKSGIFIRTSPMPEAPGNDCIKINIAPDLDPFPTASLSGQKKAQPVEPNVDWNSMRILAEGPRVKVWLNDVLKLEYEHEGQYVSKGYIGLQRERGEIAFRNIVLKPLNLRSLFDGTDLLAWNAKQSLESRFYIDKQKHLRMLGGRGQLESNDQFGDFVFSTHVRTNAPGLNSGIFFRCIPGDVMNGYESQIQNQFEDGDPTKPRDCGTGGIFRRQNARFVNAQDESWFAKTIITSGATINVWVNGCLISDWTDDRKPDPNPRRGRRLEAGTFCLQGHDPTTDVSFKLMSVRELSTRKNSN